MTQNQIIQQVKDIVRGCDSSVAIGVAVGALLSPLLAPVVLLLLPLLTLGGALAVALGAYAVLGPLGARPRDFRFALKGAYVQALIALKVARRVTVDRQWAATLARVGRHRPLFAFVDEARHVTYGELDDATNRVARVAAQAGLRSGDTVALFMENCPEYVAVWLGLAKIGVRTALVNSNLRNEQLTHSFKVAECKAIVCSATLSGAVQDVHAELPNAAALFVYRIHTEKDTNKLEGAQLFDDLLSATSAAPLDAKMRAHGATCGDPVLYVYTSGTTGMPKAAKISHTRFFLISAGFSTICNVNESDRIYCPMPLYHSAGGLVGVGMTIYKGAFMVMRKKFSASNVARDVRKYECSVLQYIGEMCRFALQAPVSEAEDGLKIKAAIGNGLRPEIWEEFQERFGIEKIYEFYAATEGASALVNTENRPGAVGFVSPLVDPFIKYRIAKVDDDEQLVRDSKGRVQMQPPGEAGEMLIEIKDKGNGNRNFDGYQSAEATQKKIAKDVLVAGDRYFRTGDLLKVDKENFAYFVDRMGDTFRWRGENVSTAEVATVVAKAPPLGDSKSAEIAVYGSQLEGQDGRAGTVAIAGEKSNDFPFDQFFAHCSDKLASYSVPIFIRFLSGDMPKTSTHKVKKTELKKEGVDPAKCGDDELFYLVKSEKTYRKLDADTYKKLCDGSEKL